MYAIKKGSLFVAESGRHNSYTNKLEYAQKFNTRKEAENNACGNEYVVKII